VKDDRNQIRHELARISNALSELASDVELLAAQVAETNVAPNRPSGNRPRSKGPSQSSHVLIAIFFVLGMLIAVGLLWVNRGSL
jgi:hypothetical protein